MREYKFRMWDTQDKQFMNHSRVLESRVWDLESNGQGRFIYQQFTGLKDKKGVDIYEGDLIYKSNVTYSVMWDEEFAQYELEVKKTDYVLTKGLSFPVNQYIPLSDFEIIGNIYE